MSQCPTCRCIADRTDVTPVSQDCRLTISLPNGPSYEFRVVHQQMPFNACHALKSWNIKQGNYLVHVELEMEFVCGRRTILLVEMLPTCVLPFDTPAEPTQ